MGLSSSFSNQGLVGSPLFPGILGIFRWWTKGSFPSAISALVDEGELCPLQNPLCFIYFGSFFFEGRSQGISPLPWNIMNIMIERGNSTTTETYSLPCSPQEGLSSVDALIG